MTTRPKALDIARKAFGQHGGMLRTGEALQLGIHPRTLYELRDRGVPAPSPSGAGGAVSRASVVTYTACVLVV